MSYGLFNTHTTYQVDYVDHKMPRQVLKQRPNATLHAVPKDSTKAPQMDLETMKFYQTNVHVPFDLFHRPKDCVNTNPFEDIKFQRKDESNEFTERLQARRIRPRVFMIPQISMDDVDEDMMYRKNGLSDNIYTSDWKKATEFTKELSKNTIYDTPLSYKTVDVQCKPVESLAPIEPGMQKYSKNWDKFQLRANIDTSDLFWQRNQDKAVCSVCKPMAMKRLSHEEIAEINSCLSDDTLRMPYQLRMPGYCGHMPQIPDNIKPKKVLFSRVDPWLSSTMVAQGVYKKL